MFVTKVQVYTFTNNLISIKHRNMKHTKMEYERKDDIATRAALKF